MAAHQIAQGIAKLGRNGDSTLMHVTPHEVAGLQALAKSQGTSLTINPHTGLPEAFSLGGFFSSLLPVLAGGLTGGAGAPLWAGIAAGAATGAATSKNPLMGALMGGMGGYGGFGLGSGLANMGAANVAANPEGFANAAAINASNAGGASAVGNSIADGAALINQAPNQAIAQGVTQAGGNIADPLTQDFMKNAGENLARSGQNLRDVATFQPGAWDSFKQGLNPMGAPVSDLSAAGKIGMPLGGAVLGGLEPSDIYGNPIQKSNKDKYDPYATLNLGGDSGLRLLASGGPVSFADGGDSNKELSLDPVGLPGGGLGAMEGSGQYEVSPGGAQLGLFATADQIDAARQADALAKASQGRGLGSFQDVLGSLRADPRALGMKVFSDFTGRKFEPINDTASDGYGLGRLYGATAPTAKTAQTGYEQLAHLNLNKQYADGGYVSNDIVPPPVLSQDGYGLGRLNAMSQGGMPSYAEGGETSLNLDEIPSLNLGTGQSGGMGGMGGDAMYSFNDNYAFSPVFKQLFAKMPQSDRASFLAEPGLRAFMGIQERPKHDYFTASGNTISSYAKGGYLDGEGDGMSDSIPATIEGKQPARLADGEFVVPADVVSHLGNGSTKAGSKRLYAMLDKVRQARTGTKKQGKQINPNKFMPV